MQEKKKVKREYGRVRFSNNRQRENNEMMDKYKSTIKVSQSNAKED